MSLAAPIASPTALEANGGNLNESPVGTGPYKFVEWNPSEDIILTRNDEYWREPAKTKILYSNSFQITQLVS